MVKGGCLASFPSWMSPVRSRLPAPNVGRAALTLRFASRDSNLLSLRSGDHLRRERSWDGGREVLAFRLRSRLARRGECLDDAKLSKKSDVVKRLWLRGEGNNVSLLMWG